MIIPRNKLQHLMLMAGMLFCFACNEDKPAEVKAEVQVVQKNPFKFYKDIEVKPGQNFEIVSWGKGVDSVGGYQILMSDSIKNNYKSVAVERKGVISDAWNMDLDNDGNPELYIQLINNGTMADLNVFEYAGGGFNKISFPSLSSSQIKGYKGSDNFFIKNGDLFRSFPVKDPADSTKSIIKTYQYNLRANGFSATELKDDSVKGKN
ncbi:hypothetical protein [Pedobacter sp. BMA]|uniref:hypothetical protein n=1 Tax=Pedobacter sp. BMA TaxID=1663685 RepID=UPI00064AF4FF|nr:hypothetical protein [Pedobacter sp. BMA]KLT67358.1 hypothetical protein AB669_01215 [Pedobacter sp. BMA]